jgi:hypothetical protein
MTSAPNETHYEVLSVPGTASPEEIRAAYLKLVVLYHPDKHSGNPLQELAAQKLARINAAYEVLSDSRLRAEYDARLAQAGIGARVAGTPRRPIPWWIKGIGAIAVGLVLLLVLRPLLRLIVASSGTPLKLVLVGVLVAGAALWWLRRRRSRQHRNNS